MKRLLIQDKYNSDKTWEINHISHGFYLKQYIKGKQFGKGVRTTKKWLKEIGLLDMKVISIT